MASNITKFPGLLSHRAKAFWLTGLSNSGKTTIAEKAAEYLRTSGLLVKVLDGDSLRTGVNKDLDFTRVGKIENIRRSAEISKLFIEAGFITLNCFICPNRAMRDLARRIIGVSDFHEIYVNASVNHCENRDTKGLYRKARAGEITNFPGVNYAYEVPLSADLIVDTDDEPVEKSVVKLIEYIQYQTRFEAIGSFQQKQFPE